ncbi:DNA topoisomerase II [Aphelenchoides avenae]|nr:DNA topoisomerase II [Aphelenchus avenae]
MNVGYCQGPKTPKKFVIDGKNVGNVGRLFSHSCRPNMTCHSVYTDTHDTRLPVAALFTRKLVKPGDPLTYHYGPKYVKKDKRTGVTMMAGSFPCGCDECAKNAKAK